VAYSLEKKNDVSVNALLTLDLSSFLKIQDNLRLSETIFHEGSQRRATSDMYSNCKSLWIKESAK